MPTQDTFESVLRAARANADWAWREMYGWYAPGVLQFLRVQRAEHAEDVLGEVFLDVVRSLHTFAGGPDEFRSWLFRMAQNRLIDQRRSRRRRPETTADEVPEGMRSRSPSAEDAVLIHEDEQRIYRLLGVLPEDQRAAVFMRVVLELQPAEIAEIMGKRVGSVKMLINRGLGSLRTRLGDDSDDRP